jgi:hypothetical protein
MKYILSLLFMTTLAPHLAGATVCDKTLNCGGQVSVERRYLFTTPVCEMTMNCDVMCGEVVIRQVRKPFYCGFLAEQGKPNTCMKPSLCVTDDSVVKSDEDVANLTDYPRSPGPGLVIPKDHKRRAQ